MTPDEAVVHFPGVDAGDAVALRGGHIHETWLVAGRWVVQRCNRRVFRDLDAVMENVAVICEEAYPELRPVPAEDGRLLFTDTDGEVWRVMPYLSFGSGTASALALGRGLGRFHRRVAGIDPGRLTVTLPHFHDPDRRLADLDAAAGAAASDASAELSAIEGLRWLAGEAVRMVPPRVPVRVAHFDAKADNFLVDATGEVQALVDLDTVMPGSWLWDVGDLIRSVAASGAEDDAGLKFDAVRCGEALAGYAAEVGDALTAGERAGVAIAPLVVTFEQAVRFLTDHLRGDVYYRVDRRGHNLERARSQLSLLESMLVQRSAMILP
jgi:Ser/Thr protein kinase RdoA (MazF antagonist)